MIAVRVRVTGHDQITIQDSILLGAPSIRPIAEKRHWQDYARRTSQYAFSAAGERKTNELAKYRHQWEELEDDAPQAPLAQKQAPTEALPSQRKKGPRV